MPRRPAPGPSPLELPADLAATSAALRDGLLFWLAEGDLTFGPLSGEQVRRGAEAGQYRDAAAMLVDHGVWVRASLVAAPRHGSAVAAVEYAREPSAPGQEGGASRASRTAPAALPPARPRQRALYAGAAALRTASSSGPPSTGPMSSSVSMAALSGKQRCPVCLERIAAGLVTCPECGEAVAATGAMIAGPPSAGSPSIPDDIPGQSALAMHWRPIVTLGAITTLVCTGIALRHLAPGRFLGVPRASGKTARGGGATRPRARPLLQRARAGTARRARARPASASGSRPTTWATSRPARSRR